MHCICCTFGIACCICMACCTYLLPFQDADVSDLFLLRGPPLSHVSLSIFVPSFACTWHACLLAGHLYTPGGGGGDVLFCLPTVVILYSCLLSHFPILSLPCPCLLPLCYYQMDISCGLLTRLSAFPVPSPLCCSGIPCLLSLLSFLASHLQLSTPHLSTRHTCKTDIGRTGSEKALINAATAA